MKPCIIYIYFVHILSFSYMLQYKHTLGEDMERKKNEIRLTLLLHVLWDGNICLETFLYVVWVGRSRVKQYLRVSKTKQKCGIAKRLIRKWFWFYVIWKLIYLPLIKWSFRALLWVTSSLIDYLLDIQSFIRHIVNNRIHFVLSG